MKRRLVVAAIFCAGSAVAFSQTLDRNKPYGRACVSVVNSANGDEEALRSNSEAGRGLKVVAHLDATAKCGALVAVFGKGGQATEWPPQFVSVPARTEVLLPKAPAAWKWEKGEGPLEVHVLFFTPGSKDSAEIKAVVSAMQGSRSAEVAKLQTNKLLELIGRAKVDRFAAEHAAKANPEVAGVLRMVVGFEWRDSARAVNFSSEKPGALIFPAAN